MVSAIRTARRERQKANIEPELITDELTGNIIFNPKLWELDEDGEYRRKQRE